jgi:hypothetical protein
MVIVQLFDAVDLPEESKIPLPFWIQNPGSAFPDRFQIECAPIAVSL